MKIKPTAPKKNTIEIWWSTRRHPNIADMRTISRSSKRDRQNKAKVNHNSALCHRHFGANITTLAHDAKRPKLEPIRLRHGSSSSSSANASGTSNGNGSNSGSSSERFLESETLPIRRERLSSNASMTESHCSTMLSNTLNRENSLDESRNSPIAGHFGRTNDPINNHQPTSRQASWRDDDRKRRTNRQQGLPSLSDMFDGSKLGIPSPASVELNPYSSGFVAANHPRSDGISITSHGRVPTLRHEPSSNGSSASASSAASYSRSSRDGSLPIHALLTGQSSHGPSRGSFDHPSPASTATSMTSPIEPPKSTLFEQAHGSRGYGKLLQFLI